MAVARRGEAGGESLGSCRRGAEAVEVLDQAEHLVPLLRLPEGRFVRCGQRVLLRLVPRADALDERGEHVPEERGLLLAPLRLERHPREREVVRAGGRLRRLRLRFARVRVDEDDIEAGLVARRDEEELVTLGELPLDDRGRDPRQ